MIKRFFAVFLVLGMVLTWILAPNMVITCKASAEIIKPAKLIDTIEIYYGDELWDKAVFQYDEYDRLTSISWDDGVGGMSVSFRYDSAGRLLSRKTDGTGAGSAEYTYNDNGQLIRCDSLSSTEGNTSDIYEYNAAGQLVTLTSSYYWGSIVTTYTYDTKGNLIKTTAIRTYNESDDDLEVPTPTYSTYSYDDQNRVIKIVSLTGSDTTTTTYNYDYKPFTVSSYASNGYTNTSILLETTSGLYLDSFSFSTPTFYCDSDGYLIKLVDDVAWFGKETWHFTYRDSNTQWDGEIIRLSGSTRFETALEIADELKETLDVEKFNAIIIASGSNAADALSGSYLAAVKSAPILLSFGNKHAANIQYVKDNLVSGGTVYILGGTAAVPGLYEDGLKGYDVVRLSGKTRYETNLEILKEAGVRAGQEVLVCNGTGFAGALSASATGLPILLVNGPTGKLTREQTGFLSTLSNSFCLIGGTGSLNSQIGSALGRYGRVTRLSGATRYETTVMVAERYFENPEEAVLAYAWNFPDGLCGGPLAYALGAPLILTATASTTQAASYCHSQGITSGVVLGGEKLISDTAALEILCN